MASNTQESTPRALLLEDTAVDRLILSRMLQMFHFEVIVVKNGKEEVDLFHEGKTFDIILCDKDMPTMAGPEAIVKIRAMGATNVKIVGVSDDIDAKEAFMGTGADFFVPKPVKTEILEPMLQEVICMKIAMV